MDGKLSDHTAEGRTRRRKINEGLLARLDEIDADQLNSKDRISYQVFRYERETERDSYEQYDHLFPISSMTGYHTYFAEAVEFLRFDKAADRIQIDVVSLSQKVFDQHVM